MTTPKSVIRRFGPFASFQQFLVSETSVGNISRQEAVSMIPPLLLDVRPGMTVLDLCAAPGSKSAQLIEMLHAGEEVRMRVITNRHKKAEGRDINPDEEVVEDGTPISIKELEGPGADNEDDWSDDGRTTGLLIANDVDYKRAHMLIHQMKRLNSPNLIVTNHDATLYPSIKLPSDPVREGGVVKGKYLKFDRILADVPCSGDGTCRKNMNVWKDWNPVNGLGLFPTQVRILVRALQMLKVGGRVVYSTCSMNPVENEAVVASAIDRCGGLNKVTIVDCSGALSELKRKPGLTSWEVMDKQGNMWSSWKEVEKSFSQYGPEGLGKLMEGMFPPRKAEPQQAFPLERCLRVYGHQQDTGGFFITVLEKQSEIRARPESKPADRFVKMEELGANGEESQTVEAEDSQTITAKDPEAEESQNIVADDTQIQIGEQDVKPEHSNPSILALVDEIESMPANGMDSVRHIDALDSFLPPNANGEDDGNPSAAARQNMENAPSYGISAQKRELDDIADAMMSTKRARFREDDDGPAPRGAEDRQVHFPPPPAAQLDAPRPNHPSTTFQQAEAHTYTKKSNNRQFEEPFKYLDPDNPELQTVYKFYSLHSRFPRDRFMVRNALGNPVKTIYYTSALARSILTENEDKGIKFVHCGVKMFVKQDVQRDDVCRWRIQTDGLPLVEAWVGEERLVRLRSRKTFRHLLVEMFPKVTGDGWKELGEIGERVRDLGMGCCVLRVEKGEGEDGFRFVYGYGFWSWSSLLTILDSERMVLPLWRSLHSLNLMLPKEDRKAMLLRLYNDDSPLMDHSKDRFRKTENDNADESDDEHTTTLPPPGGGPVEPVNGSDVDVDGGVGDDEDPDGEEGGISIGADRERERDVEVEAQAEVDVALGAKDEEDVGMDGGVELG